MQDLAQQASDAAAGYTGAARDAAVDVRMMLRRMLIVAPRLLWTG